MIFSMLTLTIEFVIGTICIIGANLIYLFKITEKVDGVRMRGHILKK